MIDCEPRAMESGAKNLRVNSPLNPSATIGVKARSVVELSLSKDIINRRVMTKLRANDCTHAVTTRALMPLSDAQNRARRIPNQGISKVA